jgi:hypothetical protein
MSYTAARGSLVTDQLDTDRRVGRRGHDAGGGSSVVVSGAAASALPVHSLDAGRVDVAAISLDSTALGLSSEDRSGRSREPGSLVYTTERRAGGVEVGRDTSDVDTGVVFGDTVTLRLRAADGPAEFTRSRCGCRCGCPSAVALGATLGLFHSLAVSL